MTDLAFCWPGKTSAAYARDGMDDYLGRIGRYQKCRVVITPEEPRSGRYSQEHRVEREGEGILKRLKDLDPFWLCALHPAGKPLNTGDFAKLVRRQLQDDGRTPVFVVGGPDGLSYAVQKRADRLLGMSSFTLPHDMARLVLVEQVYRALTIIHGHPYDR
ncbi:MAG: 23S rRNA (pseudouridine(1915)-N(3))-methyltransferase RlmH [Acidobacteria bacterium]|nr:23S rRNA (pseudouridine(1915)-N(3))-methyltransferase RlmH [Acidobacteriota bacterium]